MQDIIQLFQGGTLVFFAGAFVAAMMVLAWSTLKNSKHRKVFMLASAGFTLYAGAKHITGKVEYPRTDADVAYLVDRGSYVTNDYIYIDFVRHPIVPDSAGFIIEVYALTDTNYEHGVTLVDTTFADFPVPCNVAMDNATNYNAICYTPWTPGPAVRTNGVWRTYWGEAAGGAGRDHGFLIAIPVRTEITTPDGEQIAPPSENILPYLMED